MGRFNKDTAEPSSSLAETTSTSKTETVNGSHDFKVTGYSLSRGIGIGKYIASDTFTVGGYSLAVYFYPDGISVRMGGGDGPHQSLSFVSKTKIKTLFFSTQFANLHLHF